MTPEQLREEAVAIERMHGETLTVEWRIHMADLLRAHAAALEEIERLNKAWKAQQFHLEAEERESAHWQERAEQAERRAERLKGHAEAMAVALDIDGERCSPESQCRVCAILDAYRADKGE